MTINELEQGIRNLIATQPMVTTGATGEVVNGINSIIEACRNLSFRVSTYPCQDVMKFGLANETAKFENTLSNLALQVLQERGINLMLYIPRGGANYGSMVNSFGMVNSPVDANLMMGQMMYTPASMPTGAGTNFPEFPWGLLPFPEPPPQAPRLLLRPLPFPTPEWRWQWELPHPGLLPFLPCCRPSGQRP